MRTYLLIIFLLFSVAVNAQVPGFMGKRFTIFLEGNPTPAILCQSMNNQSIFDTAETRTEDINKFTFNFRPQITMEYLVHRDVSIGLSYSRIGMGTVKGYKLDSLDFEFVKDYDVIKGQSVGLHVKLYQFSGSASIAPIGFYQTFSAYVTQTNTYDTKKSNVKQFQNDFVYPVFSLGVGRQSMITKNLILKTGVELGFAYVPSNFYEETEDTWNAQEYAGYNLHQSLLGYYLFSFNVAIGYIPF